MFICDQNNRRVQRWLKNDNQGQTLVMNVSCYGMAMDSEGSLYDSSYDDGRVTKWPSDQLVAGGNGQGSCLNQLSNAVRLFVDPDHSVFVADSHKSRVMKWPSDVIIPLHPVFFYQHSTYHVTLLG
jgi:sugar lactone lactonase YvrE